MHSKLAGQLTLHDMIAGVLQDTRQKIAADEDKSEKVKKLLKHEKKEHGHTPNVKEEMMEEKKSSIIDPFNQFEVEKLASALEVMGDMLKEADSVEMSGEYRQGGMVLPTASPVGGKQPYKKDHSKSHSIPMHTPEQAVKDAPAATAVMADEQSGKLLKYLHSKYPEKGPLKTAASSVKEMIEAKKRGEKPEPKSEKAEAKQEKAEEMAEKKSAVSYLLAKMAGGETLYSASEEGPKPPSDAKGGNDVRRYIESSQAAIGMKKVEGKTPQKKMLSEVLTEPAYSKAHDSKVHENLRNASTSGVKIAAAKAFLHKIAEEGCTCTGKGECKHCKMKKALEKKSQGGMMGGSSMMSSPAMTPPPMTGGMY